LSDKENKDKDKNKDKKHKNKDKQKKKSKKLPELSDPKTTSDDNEDTKETIKTDAKMVVKFIEPKESIEETVLETTVSSVSTETTGTGTTYFFTQSNTLPPLDIPPDVQTTILTLPVFTTKANQQVKIDAFFQVIIGTIISAPSFAYTFNIQLLRNSSSILSVDVLANSLSKPVSVGVYQEMPCLTWTDIPPSIGMQKYEVCIRRVIYGNENNIDSVAVFTRALNAIVFP
jgi:hypothetical protein